jgi:peptide/nickel transport system substrate-binding protein
LALITAILPPALAQDWTLRVKPRGTLTVVDMFEPHVSVLRNYAEGLVTLDKDGKVAPCLAKDWRWLNDRTIEFLLRKDVTFHNGEEFNAEAVRINWEAYKKLKNPRVITFTNISDETEFEIIDDFVVRFTFPEPEGLIFVKFGWFFMAAPAFLKQHQVAEKNWLYLPEPGPWGTGPFVLREGAVPYGKPSDRIVLEAYGKYWDPQYPKVRKVIFDNTLIGERQEAMRLCSETEGLVDIVSHIKPLETLKIALSPFAIPKKSRDVISLWGMFNQRMRNSKWRDIRLRKAINYAINREELWKYAAKGNAYNLGGHIPVGGYGHNPDLDLYIYDTNTAKTLIGEAGYPEGFAVKIISMESWKVEAQIIAKMLERIGLKVTLDVFTWPELLRKIYVPLLDKPCEEQEWDIAIHHFYEIYGNTGATLLAFGLVDKSDFRFTDYDTAYEKMWEDMAHTVNRVAQEAKLRQMEKYIYDRADVLFIYSPISLFAVNKEVQFVPQKFGHLRLKETSVTDNHWSVRGNAK